MLDVNIEKILPVTEVRDSLNKIIDDVESSDELYVVTKNGKPTAILVGVHHLEKLTGIDHKEIMPDALADTAKDKVVDTIDVADAAKDELPVASETTVDWSTPAIDTTPKTDDTTNPAAILPPLTPLAQPVVEAPISPVATDSTNGAQANPINPLSTPDASAIAPTTPSPLATAETNSSTGMGDSNDIDDIFGPIDEEEETPAAAPSVPAPAIAPAPAPSAPSAVNVASASPADQSAMGSNPSQPPATPGQV